MKYLRIILAAAMLVVAPSCQAGGPPLTPEQQMTVEQLEGIRAQSLEDAGRFEGGSVEYLEAMQRAQDADDMIAKIETDAATSFFDFATDWLPLPEPMKKPLSVLAGSLVFPRPRRVYLQALKGIGQAVVEINPLGSEMAPGEAAKALMAAGKNMLSGAGLLDSRPDPDEEQSQA